MPVYRIGRWFPDLELAEEPFFTIEDHQINKFLNNFLGLNVSIKSRWLKPGFYWVTEEVNDRVSDWGTIEILNDKEWSIHMDRFAPKPTVPLYIIERPLMAYCNPKGLNPR